MSSNAGRKVGGDRHEDNVFGPSWFDVYVIMGELFSKFPDRQLTITLHRNTSVKKTAGLVVWVTDGNGTVWGSQRYLDRDPQSSKTAAGAFWTACTRAYHRLEEKQAIADGEYEQVDISDAEGEIPF